MLLAAVFVFFASLALPISADGSVDIFAWPLSSPKAQSLATISYNTTHAAVNKYTPFQIPADDEVVRIGFYHASGSWSGIATAASNFAPSKDKKVQLHIAADQSLYHVAFKASDQATSSKTGKGKDGLGVEVVTMPKGPTPALNKPIVLNAEGEVEGKEPEKTFLQKYWWILGVFLIFQLVVAGGAKD